MHDKIPQVPPDTDYSHYPDDAKQKLADAASEFETESHSIVFCEMNDEPVAKNMNLLAEIHVCLDVNFYGLVNKKDQKNYGKRSFQMIFDY